MPTRVPLPIDVRARWTGRRRATYLLSSTATRLMEELDPHRFARIHRRYVVNLDRVIEIEPWSAATR